MSLENTGASEADGLERPATLPTHGHDGLEASSAHRLDQCRTCPIRLDRGGDKHLKIG